MQSSNLQFHALPEEVVSELNATAKDFHVIGVTLWPHFALLPLEWPLTAEITVDRLAISATGFDKSATSLQAFAAKNPNCLHVDLPSRCGDFLTEGALGYVVENAPDVAKQWGRVMRQFKKMLSTGAVAIDPKSGAVAILKSHRFTEGALRTQGLGVVMKPCAGNAIIRLGSVKGASE